MSPGQPSGIRTVIRLAAAALCGCRRHAGLETGGPLRGRSPVVLESPAARDSPEDLVALFGAVGNAMPS